MVTRQQSNPRRNYCPLGCENWEVCDHYVKADSLREPDHTTCDGIDKWACGRHTIQQLIAIGRRGRCCRDLERGDAA